MVQAARTPLLALTWQRCGRDAHWCRLLGLDLDSDSLAKGGVYVIWSEDAAGGRKRAVYVGQGKPIADCLGRHRGEARITQHERDGRILRVTWAKVRKELRGGVEHYLADKLNPLEGTRWSDDDRVPVNLPW